MHFSTIIVVASTIAACIVSASPLPQTSPLAPGQNAPVEQRYMCTAEVSPALATMQLCDKWDATQTTCQTWKNVGCATGSTCIKKASQYLLGPVMILLTLANLQGDAASAIVLDRDTCIGLNQLVPSDPRYRVNNV